MLQGLMIGEGVVYNNTGSHENHRNREMTFSKRPLFKIQYFWEITRTTRCNLQNSPLIKTTPFRRLEMRLKGAIFRGTTLHLNPCIFGVKCGVSICCNNARDVFSAWACLWMLIDVKSSNNKHARWIHLVGSRPHQCLHFTYCKQRGRPCMLK